jgi:hypothetical protein
MACLPSQYCPGYATVQMRVNCGPVSRSRVAVIEDVEDKQLSEWIHENSIFTDR